MIVRQKDVAGRCDATKAAATSGLREQRRMQGFTERSEEQSTSCAPPHEGGTVVVDIGVSPGVADHDACRATGGRASEEGGARVKEKCTSPQASEQASRNAAEEQRTMGTRAFPHPAPFRLIAGSTPCVLPSRMALARFGM